MNEEDTKSWELKKLIAEARKMECEADLVRGNRTQEWIKTVSVSIGIVAAGLGAFVSLTEIAATNKRLAIEADIRSHDLFVNGVLDRFSGIQKDYLEFDESGKSRIVKREKYGGTTQVAAYAAAISLACKYEQLRDVAISAFEWQIKITPSDTAAPRMLQKLRRECGTESNK